MQVRVLEYNEETEKNELISLSNIELFRESASDVFNLLCELKKKQEEEFSNYLFLEVNKDGIADSINNKLYKIKEVSLVLPDNYLNDESILPYISVTVEEDIY